MDFSTGFGHALTLFNSRYCAMRTCDAMCLGMVPCSGLPQNYMLLNTWNIFKYPVHRWSHWFVLVGYRRFRMYLCGSMLGPESVSRYLWFGRGLRQFEERIRQHPFAWGTGTREVFGYGMVYIAERLSWGARMPQMWWFNGFPTKPSGLRLVRFKH